MRRALELQLHLLATRLHRLLLMGDDISSWLVVVGVVTAVVTATAQSFLP